jgi:hypothetical protein
MTRFAEYANSAHFRVELSPRMIEALLHLHEYGTPLNYWNYVPYDSLHKRGLVEWVGTSIKPKDRPIAMTAEGKLMARLLVLAGYECAGEQRVG